MTNVIWKLSENKRIDYLHPSFAESQALTELFPHESVRVVCFVKQPFKLVQLFECEIRTTPTLFVLMLLAAVAS